MNKNIQALRVLYESAFDHLHVLIQGVNLAKGGNLGDPIEHIKNQTYWIHEVGKALILVSQIEKLRQPEAPVDTVKTTRREMKAPPPPDGLRDFNPPPLPQIN